MPRIARVGDPVWCSEHGMTQIVTGSSFVFSNNKPVATVGDRTGCGATIITGVPNQFIDGALIARRGDKISHGGYIVDGCPDQWAEGEGLFPSGSISARPSPDEAPPEDLTKLTACSVKYKGGLNAPPAGQYWGLSIPEQSGLDLPHQSNNACVVMSAAQVTQLQRIRDGGTADRPFPLHQANAERLTQCPEPIKYNPENGTIMSSSVLKGLYANYGYSATTQDQSPAAIRQRLREGKILQTDHLSEHLWTDQISGGHAVATLGYVAAPGNPDQPLAYLIHDTGTGCPAWVSADKYEASLRPQEPGFTKPLMAWITGKLPGREEAIKCCLDPEKKPPFGDIKTRQGNPFAGMQAQLVENKARLAEIDKIFDPDSASEGQKLLAQEQIDLLKKQKSLGNQIYAAQEAYFSTESGPCKAKLSGSP
ncbi:PAAR domain-containing protein [Lacibacterium aquatile]|uniref:PAAR domain-containing protein n=1 Tax=Lacibacterium aquatile TaxID=1168082 RepID=A0ABW5DYN1_9PROT